MIQSWTEYQIPNYLFFVNLTNTECQIILFLKMKEYRIVLFSLDYSNEQKPNSIIRCQLLTTEYWKSKSNFKFKFLVNN